MVVSIQQWCLHWKCFLILLIFNLLFLDISRIPAKEHQSPPGSTRTKSLGTAFIYLQHTLKGIQSEDEEQGTLCSGRTGRTVIQLVRYCQEKIFMNLNSCIFPY